MEKPYNHYLLAEKRGDYAHVIDRKNCVFCNIIKDLDKAPGKIGEVFVVTAFEHSFLVVNTYPYVACGHLMVVPKRHITDYNELSSEEIDEIFKSVIPAVKIALSKEYKRIQGFNIGINMGENAGASIEHLHVHIVPRASIEAGFMEATAQTKIMHENPESTMSRLEPYFAVKK